MSTSEQVHTEAKVSASSVTEYVFLSTSAEAVKVQDKLEETLRERNFPQKVIVGIRMAMEEAMTNGIKHGNKSDPKKKIHVEYTVNTFGFTAKICDEGRGFNPRNVPDCTQNLEKPSGRGLLMMQHFMDTVEIIPPATELQVDSSSDSVRVVPSLNTVRMWKRRTAA